MCSFLLKTKCCNISCFHAYQEDEAPPDSWDEEDVDTLANVRVVVLCSCPLCTCFFGWRTPLVILLECAIDLAGEVFCGLAGEGFHYRLDVDIRYGS